MTEHPTPAGQADDIAADPAPVFNADVPHATPQRPLSDAARRALQEAADRRAHRAAAATDPEHGGPKGPEPTRYGDWEKKGIAVDF
ncbi:MAG: DUF1674 domain-containing protein [Brevundimonas sp.]|uniref:DUF1674 domain-containing protein n=1 Tax=Brevundimonas sp. TaxID=1871086 RepID=UPI00391B0C9E